jgi:hypothetical protein
MSKVHNGIAWARDNPYDIRERGYRVRFSANICAGVGGDILGYYQDITFPGKILLDCLNLGPGICGISMA